MPQYIAYSKTKVRVVCTYIKMSVHIHIVYVYT